MCVNKVSYTLRLTVGSVPQVVAVILGCSRKTFLFIGLLAGKPEENVLNVGGLCPNKTQHRSPTKECKNGDRSYSTPRSPPNAEGLQTNCRNKYVYAVYDL